MMEAATTQILASLKEISNQLVTLNSEWSADKGKIPAKQSNMIQGLDSQITAMGNQLENLVKSLKTTQGMSCKICEDAKSQSKTNADYLDDLDQRSLMGKIAITVQDPDLRRRIGILETGDYNSFDLQLLVH